MPLPDTQKSSIFLMFIMYLSKNLSSTSMANLPFWYLFTWGLTWLKGIMRPFEFEEIYLFYYLIDAGEFSYSNDMH